MQSCYEDGGMNLGETKDPTSKFVGIGFVIGLHVLIVYALASGLAHQMVEVMKSPLETKIIKEEKPPDEDTPPPPPPPKLVAPPPPYIPPPEISIQQTQSVNAITAVQKEVVVPKPAPTPQVAVVAPPVHVPAGTDPNKYCPRKPDYPSLSKRNSEEGTVILEFLIGDDGSVKDSKVVQSSGHTRLDEAARSGLSSYCHFKPATDDGKPVQTWQQLKYTWRLDD
jgi:protein TonB